MEGKKLEDQRPKDKSEIFGEWLDGFNAREAEYIEDQKNSQGAGVVDSDKAGTEFSGSIPPANPEIFIESLESNLESLRERIRVLERQSELPGDAERAIENIKGWLHNTSKFLDECSVSYSPQNIKEWLQAGHFEQAYKTIDKVSKILSLWEKTTK
ncbi:MAG: hypothetical protein Q7R94_02670 [bacterium]|nr:hypothetical protein [bacterium]